MFSSKFTLPFWVGFLYIATLKFKFISCSVGNANVGCLETELQALLNFKQGLNDPSDRLSSWVGENCCRWTGVRCTNSTGHVESLSLQNPYEPHISIREFVQTIVYHELEPKLIRSCISGEINPSLLELKYLKHLDLSINCFGGIGIPKFIGLFSQLRYLNLSRAGFGGRVPHELGNLSSLRYLDLNNEGFLEFETDAAHGDSDWPSYNLYADSLHWLSHLFSLKHLDMGNVNLSKAADWLLSLNMLPSIQNLQLSNCSLGSIPSSLSYVNFTFLSTLDLSQNMHGPTIPTWLFNISRMTSLNLGFNNFGDFISTALGTLCRLKSLDLSSNSFRGDINRFKECFQGCISSSLEDLDLGSNELSGCLPDWLGHFTNLKSLNLSNNSLSGMIPSTLMRLSSLRTLSLSNNQLNGSISEGLGQLSDLVTLDVKKNSFNAVLSEAHFSNLKNLKRLSMSSNSITFNVSSNWIPPFQLKIIEMDNCKVGPQFPSWLQTQNELRFLSFSEASISDTIPDFFWQCFPNIFYIDLSNNSISGSIGESVGEKTTNLLVLSLSFNRLNGSIPLTLCKTKYLVGLFLSNNHLTDEIPQCIGDLQYLSAMVFMNNNLSGVIPTTISGLSRLSSLHLNKNNLSGEIPPSLKNCTALVTLDFGENRFSGKIPKWIGEELSSLKFLILRSNKFYGELPPELSLLSKLQFLDLAQNNITGRIPTSFSNFSAMAAVNMTKKRMDRAYYDSESIWVAWKGGDYEYSSTISLLVQINLSGNHLRGEIPTDITCLFGLQNLNLSKNHLTGKIPQNISSLRWIESLDLSCNHLSGEIPNGLSLLTSLSSLNLSYNNFSGRIPSGRQLDTIINSSRVMGNPFLCGLPLLNQCPKDETSHDTQPVDDNEESKDKLPIHLFYISMILGFIVGFWIVCGILLLKRSWRIAYYHFFDQMLLVCRGRKK